MKYFHHVGVVWKNGIIPKEIERNLDYFEIRISFK